MCVELFLNTLRKVTGKGLTDVGVFGTKVAELKECSCFDDYFCFPLYLFPWFTYDIHRIRFMGACNEMQLLNYTNDSLKRQ